MKRQNSIILTVALLISTASASHAARIVCWTNSDGVRECGNSVPPEYAQKRIETKSALGITVGRTARAKTEEELAAIRAEQARKKAEEAERRRLAAEQAQYDRVLLATFTTEQDLELTRNGKIAAIDSRIKHSRQVGAKLDASMQELQAEAARLERGGKTLSDDLRARIQEVSDQISENRDDIARRQQEKVQLNQRFDMDLARYRELKQTGTN